jgi:hypothetical protein
VQWVIMLHGDGQYAPELLEKYEPYFDSDFDVVYGYRSKAAYGKREETPLMVWLLIKMLSFVESVVTGFWRREWHTGFVMYSTKFLRIVNMAALTETPHIDGHLLYASGLLGGKVAAVPIYKLYKELTAFEGEARRKYVFSVLRLMFQFKKIDVRKTASSVSHTSDYTVELSPLIVRAC